MLSCAGSRILFRAMEAVLNWNVHFTMLGTNHEFTSQNFTSGKNALRQACADLRAGHQVQLITGPSGETIDLASIENWCRNNADRLPC